MSDFLSSPLFFSLAALLGGSLAYYLLFGNKRSMTTPAQAQNPSAGEGDFIFVNAGKATDIPKNSMRDIEVSEDLKVLLVHTQDGAFFSIGNKCTHYGAPLSKGTLRGNRVICPWHAACFNACSGDIEDAPAIDKVDKFDVHVNEGGEVIVKVPKNLPKGFRRLPTLTKADTTSDSRVFVIVGAGAAGAVAAQTLREEGFKGKIVLIGKEKHIPYDRIKCSKALSLSLDTIALRPADFYQTYGIELLLGKSAVSLVLPADKKKGTVGLDDGTKVDFDQVLLATGGNCRQLKAEGYDLKNIFTVRFIEDANGIGEAAKTAQKAVIIGSSFIGMEVAACLIAKKIQVTVVGMEKEPFERVLGEEVGAAMRRLHESKGVSFRMQRTLKRFIGAEGVVKGVELDNGETLDADLVVIGAGIIAATEFLQGTLPLERDGSVVVNEYLSAQEGVYVAGDIARFKYGKTGETIRIEHWDVAQQHGRIAARNMLGKKETYQSVPFFWTSQYNVSVRYAGNAMKWDSVLVKGSIEQNKFAAYYVLNGRAQAVTTVGVDPLATTVSELISTNALPSADVLAANPLEYPISLLSAASSL